MPCDLVKCGTHGRRPLAPECFRRAGKDRKVWQTVGGDIAGTTCKMLYKCLKHALGIVQVECLNVSISIAFVVFTVNLEIDMRMISIRICDSGSPEINHASPHVALNDPDRHTCADACGREGLIRTGRELCASKQMPCDLLACRS
jgi:hypothetical protein